MRPCRAHKKWGGRTPHFGSRPSGLPGVRRVLVFLVFEKLTQIVLVLRGLQYELVIVYLKVLGRDRDASLSESEEAADIDNEVNLVIAIDDDIFGGWASANPKFFDAESGIITLIQQATGKSS